MDKLMCYGCFKEKIDDGPCPICGFDNVQDYDFLKLGTEVDNYIIGKRLGERGFSKTYLALNKLMGVKVAIKECFISDCVIRDIKDGMTVIPKEGKEKIFQEIKDMTINEAKRLNELQDAESISNIVPFKNLVEANGTSYIIMKYIEGRNLESIAEERRKSGKGFSLDEVLELTGPIFVALEKLHNAGMVHRDVSPDNIMIDAKRNPILIDFGAARSAGGIKTKMFRKGPYTSYEQYLENERVSIQEDIYSMAVILYVLLSGLDPEKKIPTSNMRYERINSKHKPSDPLASLSVYRKDIPEYAVDTIMKGLAVRKEDRFATMEEFYRAINGNTAKAPKPMVQQQKARGDDKLSAYKDPDIRLAPIEDNSSKNIEKPQKKLNKFSKKYRFLMDETSSYLWENSNEKDIEEFRTVYRFWSNVHTAIVAAVIVLFTIVPYSIRLVSENKNIVVPSIELCEQGKYEEAIDYFEENASRNTSIITYMRGKNNIRKKYKEYLIEEINRLDEQGYNEAIGELLESSSKFFSDKDNSDLLELISGTEK